MSNGAILYIGLVGLSLIVGFLVWKAVDDWRERRHRRAAAEYRWRTHMDAQPRPEHHIPVGVFGEQPARFVRHDPSWRAPAASSRPAVQTGPIGSAPAQHPSSAPVGGIDPVVGFGLGMLAGQILHSAPEAHAMPDPTPQVDVGGSCPDTGFASSYDSGGGFDGGGFSGGGE